MPEVPVYVWGVEAQENPHDNCMICRKKLKTQEGPVCERCRPHLLKKHKELQAKVTGGEYRRNPAKSNLKVGDHVAVSAKFLRSIAAQASALAFGRGVVTWVQTTPHYQLVKVKWTMSPAGRGFYKASEIPEKWIGSNLIAYDPKKGIPLENPLTKKEFDNIMAEAKVHRRIPKEFYQGEASGMEDIAKQYKSNPPMTKIYNRILEVRASKEGMPHHCDAACKAAGHRYKHKFSSRACIYGLPDGSFLVK